MPLSKQSQPSQYHEQYHEQSPPNQLSKQSQPSQNHEQLSEQSQPNQNHEQHYEQSQPNQHSKQSPPNHLSEQSSPNQHSKQSPPNQHYEQSPPNQLSNQLSEQLLLNHLHDQSPLDRQPSSPSFCRTSSPRCAPFTLPPSPHICSIYPLTDKQKDKSVLICGRSARQLGNKVASLLNISLTKLIITQFSNGEIFPKIFANVQKKHVYLIQSVCPPDVNGYLVELLLTIAMLKEASAKTITAIIPYYGYSRQNQEVYLESPISASLMAHLYKSAGVSRVVSFDLHCDQIQGFFPPTVPCNNIPCTKIAIEYFIKIAKKKYQQNIPVAVVASNTENIKRAKMFLNMLQKRINIPATLITISQNDSTYECDQKSDKVNCITVAGIVYNRACIIIDDMVDTAKPLCLVANTLKIRGAESIYAYATHGVFNESSIRRIECSLLDEVAVCDTIPPPQNLSMKIQYLSVDYLLAGVISSIISGQSITKLLE